MRAWLTDIFLGDDAKPSADSRGPRWLCREDGMIAFVTLVATVFFLILIAFVANAAKVTATKMEVQNGADSLAYSAALVKSRAMNGVTAANHVIGELLALVVLHHALGEDFSEQPNGDGDSDERDSQSTELEMMFELCDALKEGMFQPTESIHNDVQKDELPDCGATIYRSCMRLQKVLKWTYQALAVGLVFWKFRNVPIVGPIFAIIGGTICTASIIIEKKVWFERLILKVLYGIGGTVLKPIRIMIEFGVIRVLHTYSADISRQVYREALTKTREQLQTANLLDESEIAPFSPSLDSLPVRLEDAVDAGEDVQKSQLMRATYPWVNHWRQDLLVAMTDWLRLARTAHYFRHYTDFYSYLKVREQHGLSIQLPVLRGAELAKKGTESWAKAGGRTTADQHFGVMAFGLRQPPKRWAANVFPLQNRDGIMAFSQAMIYNANAQQPSQGLGETQAVVGWDTLNWNSTVPEIESEETIGDYYQNNWDRWGNYRAVVVERHAQEPRIRVNWHAKLVPVSMLDAPNVSVRGNSEVIRKRLDRSSSQFRTH